MSKHPKLNTIRIIGGHWRGRRLTVPQVEGLRPTIDRVRETLFNWLMPNLVDARCLDLFAGSGALGLESLSRGANFVHFVEFNGQAVSRLQQNLTEFSDAQFSMRSKVTKNNALVFLAEPPTKPYDVVFVDPPFQSDLASQSLSLLECNGWLAEGARIYLEQEVHQESPSVPSSWTLHRQGKAGQSAYYLYISKAES